MKQIIFSLPSIDKVVFTIEAMPEDTPVRGNAMSSGDDKVDKRRENKIIRQLESGNEWAWCTVKVTASFNEIRATDYLGCCSYKSKADFIKNSGYYEDMRQTTYDELISKLEAFAK